MSEQTIEKPKRERKPKEASYVQMKADNNPPTFACTNKDQGQNPTY